MGTITGSGNGNGTAFLARTLTILVAVVGITVAIYAPMGQRITALETQHAAMELKLEKIETDARMVYLLKTDLLVVNKELNEFDQWLTWWRTTYPMLNAKQDEKLDKLEWYVYGKGASNMFKDQPVYDEK